jgi:hypothetical protein
LTKFEKLREFLENPARLCKHTMAMDKQRRAVPWHSPKACRWCLSGATFKLEFNFEDVLILQKECEKIIKSNPKLLLYFNLYIYPADPMMFLNDYTDHQTVLQVIDNSIEKEKNGAFQEV